MAEGEIEKPESSVRDISGKVVSVTPATECEESQRGLFVIIEGRTVPIFVSKILMDMANLTPEMFQAGQNVVFRIRDTGTTNKLAAIVIGGAEHSAAIDDEELPEGGVRGGYVRMVTRDVNRGCARVARVAGAAGRKK